METSLAHNGLFVCLILSFRFFYFSFIYMFCVLSVCRALGSQKWTLNPLELNLQTALSCPVGAGLDPRSFGGTVSMCACCLSPAISEASVNICHSTEEMLL